MRIPMTDLQYVRTQNCSAKNEHRPRVKYTNSEQKEVVQLRGK